jgi:hypothetical protein
MSRDMRQRKRAYYTGDLAKPIEWAPPILPQGELPKPTEDWPPRWVEVWPLAVERARQEDARNREVGLSAYHGKFIALIVHFKIDCSRRGWCRDLALNLALRHEQDFMRGSRISYAVLFERYGIDPDQPNAEFALVLALADRYVPGMRLQPRASPESRLSTIDLIRFTIAVAAVDGHLKQSIGRSPDRRVVTILRDPKRLSLIIQPAAAKEVNRIITTLGNKKRGVQGPLSEKTLRDYLSWIKTAWTAYCEDRANSFQQQFVLEVLPFINSASRTGTQEHGQI